MARLTREEILGRGPVLKRREVEIDGWDGSVLIREFNGHLRKEVEMEMISAQERKTAPDLCEKVACYAIIDDDGRPLFDLKDDKAIFRSFSGKALIDILKAVLDLSGMSEEAQALAKEELEKNPQSGDGSN